MREAQKMMADPAFQAQMKKMTGQPGFKEHMAKSQEVLNDPEKVKELEAQMQDKLKEGNELLEKHKQKDIEEETEGGKGKEDDKKEAAKEEEDTEEVPDMTSLNLN
jgi:hypothetical protein